MREGLAMTGQRIKLGKGFKIKDGKLTKVAYFANASAAIKAKKSKRARPQKRIV
jgi:hypothetical protein